MTTTKYVDHAAAVTAQLIEAIETSKGEKWSAPWHHSGQSIWAPTNATTHTPYRGGNVVTLAIEALLRNEATQTDPAIERRGQWTGEYATYRQWASIGAQVRKGESGTRCVRWVPKKSDNDQTDTTTDDHETSNRMVPKTFVVFNAAQVDGYNPAPVGEPVELLTEAETDIAATGAVILHGGDRAFYRPTSDTIQIPDRHRFHTTAAMYGTTFHELTHWSGAAHRIGRDYGKRFGDDAYAVEELTAELGAALLTARYGMANEARTDHATYLAGWLKILGEQPAALVSIANQAQTAVDFIASTSPNNTGQDPAIAGRGVVADRVRA